MEHAPMVHASDHTSKRPERYADVQDGEPGIVLGGREIPDQTAKEPEIKAYDPVVIPLDVVVGRDDRAWHTLLDSITTHIGNRLPDCSMHRSPGSSDSRVDWVIGRSHSSGLHLQLECIATRREQDVHADFHRFVWFPRPRRYRIASYLWWIAGIPSYFLWTGGTLWTLWAAICCSLCLLGSLVVLALSKSRPPVTRDVESQSYSMFLDAQAACFAAKDNLG